MSAYLLTAAQRYALAYAELLSVGWPPVAAAELAALHLEMSP